MLENKNPWYKKWWAYLLGVVMIAIIIAIPFIINYAYLKGTADGQPNTAFSANDLLSIYGTILAFTGTVVLGIIAIIQNNRATDISNRAYNDLKMAQLPLFEATNNFTLENTPLYNIKNERWDMAENYGADMCFTMQNNGNKFFHAGYFLFKLKNISNFPVKSLKVNKISVSGIGKTDFVALTPSTGDCYSLAANTDRLVCIKTLCDTKDFYRKDVNSIQMNIHFECSTQENRLVEFSFMIIKSQNYYSVIGPLSTKYKEEK